MKKVVSHLLIIPFLYVSLSGSVLADNGVYILQPGDILEISVWKEPDLQREVLVTPDGSISFPLVGTISVDDLSLKKLNDAVEKRIAKFIPDPVVTVSLKQMLGNRIYVLGKVNKPGEFVATRTIDVLQALSMAGGLNPFAASDKIQILRRNGDKQTAMMFSYGAVEKGDLKQNRLLQAGDIILVP